MKELTCGPAGWQDRCPAGSPNTLEILAVDILWRLPIIVLIVRYLILYGDRGSGQNRLLVVFDKTLPLQLREDRTNACLAALWLRFNFFDESHAISQEIHNPTGSFWHGILHRREPDYGNAKYWFRRVGKHPIYPQLNAAARELATASTSDLTAAFLTRQDEWDPFAFVDLVESVANKSSALEKLCRQIQQLEWQLLFDYCYQAGGGKIGAKI